MESASSSLRMNDTRGWSGIQRHSLPEAKVHGFRRGYKACLYSFRALFSLRLCVSVSFGYLAVIVFVITKPHAKALRRKEKKNSRRYEARTQGIRAAKTDHAHDFCAFSAPLREPGRKGF